MITIRAIGAGGRRTSLIRTTDANAYACLDTLERKLKHVTIMLTAPGKPGATFEVELDRTSARKLRDGLGRWLRDEFAMTG